MILRWLIGLPLAALVTFGLFAFMSGMIGQDVRLDHTQREQLKPIVAKLQPKPPVPTGPTRPDEIPAPKEIVIDFPDGSDNPAPVTIGPLPTPGPGDSGPIDLGGSAGPEIKVAPAFPENCRSRGVEGVVIVEFDVTAEGAVTNIRILSSPHSCFERAVKRSVSRWKYSPRKVNGRAVPRRGVREAINFQLS